MLFSPPKRSSESASSAPLAPALRQTGAYLTDGHRLFRVVSPLRWMRRPDVALLEDCLTLDVSAFPSDVLARMPLIEVEPMSEGAA